MLVCVTITKKSPVTALGVGSVKTLAPTTDTFVPEL
jgi:hypothetical protein